MAILTYKGAISSMDSVTSTATIDGNTSEYGPIVSLYAALDCSIIHFSPVVQGNDVKLNWRAVCNNNFLYFDLEHSTDGKNFSRLRTINPGEFNKITDYEYVHLNPDAGKNYYRLRMVNIEERIKYSAIVYADIKANSSNGLEALSGLFNDNIQIRVKADKKELISLQLFNEQGKLVRYKEINAETGINCVQLDNTGQLSAGAYFLQLTKEGEKFTRKIIKQ